MQAVGGLQRVAKRCLVACGASRVDPAHQDPIDEIRVVAIRLLAHLDFDLVGDRAEGLGLLAARLDRFNELPATGELLAGRDLLWFVGHLAHLTDEAGRTREAYSPQDWGHRLPPAPTPRPDPSEYSFMIKNEEHLEKDHAPDRNEPTSNFRSEQLHHVFRCGVPIPSRTRPQGPKTY